VAACSGPALGVRPDRADALPAALGGPGAAGESARAPSALSLPLFALVDADYRTQVPHWQERIAAIVLCANEVVEPVFGIRLELVEVRAWPRQGGRALAPLLDELAAAEPATGPGWVAGFVSAPPEFGHRTPLGVTRPGGRQIVLRAAPESLELAGRTPSGRCPHREVAVLLHEWAHTLGAVHEASRDSLMSGVYDPAQSTFSADSRGLIRDGLRARLERASTADEGRFADVVSSKRP
jgi:hypothetical protein